MAGSVGDGEFGFQIAPMLDVLFVLLLFFMVSAGAQKHEATISTQLPGGQPGNDIPIKVELDAEGQVSINGQPYDDKGGHDLPQTVGRLKSIVADNSQQPIVLIPESSSRHQRVVDVLNACHAAGVKNLAFGSSE
jgi:biopolymer transport protein ExbD